MMSDLPFDDQTDFDNAERGRIDGLDPRVVRAADGRVVWDLTAYSYLDTPDPAFPIVTP
jgi:alkyl sulfatase BDS1-like metallo-beta-lactamase superfamily hydrolase